MIGEMALDIVSRAEWGARVALGPSMPLPASEVWIHHSDTPMAEDPIAAMRRLEAIGDSRFGRFSYSYAVHWTGAVLEGAGTSVGAHTRGRNSRAFGIVFIGDFTRETPSPDALASCRELIQLLVDRGALVPGNYPTAGHRENPLSPSACPGNNLFPHVHTTLAGLYTPSPVTAAPGDPDMADVHDQLARIELLATAAYRSAEDARKALRDPLKPLVQDGRHNTTPRWALTDTLRAVLELRADVAQLRAEVEAIEARCGE